MPILETTPSGRQIANVSLARSGKALGVDLTMVGAGLGRRKILVVKLNVFVLQIFLSSPEKFIRTDASAVATAALSGMFAATITFLRPVTVARINSRFMDAMLANNLDPQDPDLQKLFSAITNNCDVQTLETVTMLVQNGPDCSLTCETSRGKSGSVVGGADFGKKIILLWLGAPADADAAETRENVLQFQV